MANFFPTTGAELQAAITNCALGDNIILAAGSSITVPNFGILLPNKGEGDGWVTITTDDIDGLPAKLSQYPSNYSFTDETQYRITTAEAVNMPKLKSGDGYSIFYWGHGAHHWKLRGIEFTNSSTFTAYLIADVGYQPTLDDLPSDNWVEYCWFHPKEEVGYIDVDYQERSVEKGLGYNGSGLTVKNCAIQGFTGYDPTHSYRMDTNAIIYGLGSGDILIENCLLEGQANNLWLGGGTIGFATEGSTINSATATSATFTSTDGLEVGDLFGVNVQGLRDILVTAVPDPNGQDPGSLIAGFAVGKVTEIDGNDVTYENLTSNATFRVIRIKFDTGVYGGTFTITYLGQTTAPITFPTALTISSINTASPTQVTTTTPHGLSTGNRVTISGMSGGIDNNGYSVNYDWTITVTGASTFTLNDSGTRTSSSGAGKVRSRTALQTNIQAALVALSNLGPSDVSVNASALYASSPTFGADISFAESTPPLLITNGDISINDAGLTGSTFISGRLEQTWLESYRNLYPTIVPDDGAIANWDGLLPDGVTVRRNIIAKYHLWNEYMGPQKGFGEMKIGLNYLFDANIWSGQATGMILEVKNQGGDAPWSTIQNCTFSNNIWSETGSAIAWAPSDGSNRTTPGSNLIVSNNLFLDPAPPNGDASFFGNSTVGGGEVLISHNTVFESYRMTFVVCGTSYDGPEEAGFSKVHNWVVRDNFILYTPNFWGYYNDTPTVPPYNNGNMLDAFSNATMDTNAIINFNLLPEDYGQFFALFPNNWKINDTVASVGFIDAPASLDYTGNYELEPSSIYAAGNARDASDGEDMGCNIPLLIAALGFNPFNPDAAIESVRISGQVVFTGGVVIG